MRATEHGELWEVRLDKVRPVVIVSRDDERGRRLKATVAAVTTAIRELQTYVLLDHRDGLPKLSAVNCDELQTIPKAQLTRRLGRLSAAKIDEIDDALRFALQLR